MELFSAEGCAHKNGFIQLATEFPFYEPGNTVNGTIYLRVTSMIQGAQGIELEVKGGSKQKFSRFYTVPKTDEEGEVEFEEEEEKLKSSKKFLNYKDFVWPIPAEMDQTI